MVAVIIIIIIIIIPSNKNNKSSAGFDRELEKCPLMEAFQIHTQLYSKYNTTYEVQYKKV